MNELDAVKEHDFNELTKQIVDYQFYPNTKYLMKLITKLFIAINNKQVITSSQINLNYGRMIKVFLILFVIHSHSQDIDCFVSNHESMPLVFDQACVVDENVIEFSVQNVSTVMKSYSHVSPIGHVENVLQSDVSLQDLI